MKTTKIVHDIDETFGFQNRNLCDAMKNYGKNMRSSYFQNCDL